MRIDVNRVKELVHLCASFWRDVMSKEWDSFEFSPSEATREEIISEFERFAPDKNWKNLGRMNRNPDMEKVRALYIAIETMCYASFARYMLSMGWDNTGVSFYSDYGLRDGALVDAAKIADCFELDYPYKTYFRIDWETLTGESQIGRHGEVVEYPFNKES